MRLWSGIAASNPDITASWLDDDTAADVADDAVNVVDDVVDVAADVVDDAVDVVDDAVDVVDEAVDVTDDIDRRNSIHLASCVTFRQSGVWSNRLQPVPAPKLKPTQS